jgi:hypothetical protein
MGDRKKQKQRRNAMLIQIGQSSVTLTPFGSLGDAHSAGADGSGQGSLVHRRPKTIKLAWRWICSLFLAA